MALPTPILAALERLRTFYNGDKYAPAAQGNLGNPGGLDGDGHVVNFVPALRDTALAASGVLDAANAAVTVAQKAASDTQAAAILVQGGPVSSFQVGDGPIQTGAVNLNLDALSAELEAEIAKVRETQAQLAATQADITDSSQSYALAFGG